MPGKELFMVQPQGSFVLSYHNRCQLPVGGRKRLAAGPEVEGQWVFVGGPWSVVSEQGLEVMI